MKLEVINADILLLDVEVITNAANSLLVHAGGIAGVIAKAAGP